MTLPPGVLHYLIVGQTIIPIFINVAVNIVLGVLSYSSRDAIPTWSSENGAAADSVGTCFFLPFITSLIATPIVRRHVARGTVGSVSRHDLPRWMLFFRRRLLVRSIFFGMASLVLLAGPVIAVYRTLAGETIPTSTFLVIKATFASVLGIFVTPLIALIAMTDFETLIKPPWPGCVVSGRDARKNNEATHVVEE